MKSLANLLDLGSIVDLEWLTNQQACTLESVEVLLDNLINELECDPPRVHLQLTAILDLVKQAKQVAGKLDGHFDPICQQPILIAPDEATFAVVEGVNGDCTYMPIERTHWRWGGAELADHKTGKRHKFLGIFQANTCDSGSQEPPNCPVTATEQDSGGVDSG